jgi:hypothetical protein
MWLQQKDVAEAAISAHGLILHRGGIPAPRFSEFARTPGAMA